MIRTKGEPGTGNIVEAVRHLRRIKSEIRKVMTMPNEELMTEAKNLGAPFELLLYIKEHGSLPVPNFAAGGIATPADAALAMQLGAESVFVGSGIFKSENPVAFARAIVKATTQFNKPSILLEASMGLPKAMTGIEISKIISSEIMSKRGW
jgi:pyridoxal 5'-phosphate synthase pdxS subunit